MNQTNMCDTSYPRSSPVSGFVQNGGEDYCWKFWMSRFTSSLITQKDFFRITWDWHTAQHFKWDYIHLYIQYCVGWCTMNGISISIILCHFEYIFLRILSILLKICLSYPDLWVSQNKKNICFEQKAWAADMDWICLIYFTLQWITTIL